MIKKVNRRSFLIGTLASCTIAATTITPLFGEKTSKNKMLAKESASYPSSSKLREADKVKITVLVDNYTDLFLQNSNLIRRPRIPPPNSLLGEPGFSCLIEVSAGFEKHLILFDGGLSATCLFNNMKMLGVKSEDIDAMVLSHGHYDHFGGINGFFTRTKKAIPLFVHPDAFLERRYKKNAFLKMDMTCLDEKSLKANGAIIRKSTNVSTAASDLVLITGKIERNTSFENGFPQMEAKINNRWVADPFNDDQAICINLKNHGLIVIGGCSHAGIINTVIHSRKISGIEKVHAVAGGFHLSGAEFDPTISPTIKEMQKINPDYVAPMHCTGWKAINRFGQEMPKQFLLSCVGTTFVFS